MSYFYDEELPAGFQDADFEMRELEEAGNRIALLERQGFCPHTHWVGLPTSGAIYYAEQVGLIGDEVRCHGCGVIFENDEDLHYADPIKVESDEAVAARVRLSEQFAQFIASGKRAEYEPERLSI